jgi:hypothetical protein
LAANNGDTLGEAVISVEVMNSDQNVKKNSNTKQQTEKLYFIIINHLFSAKFKGCKPITVLKISKP